MLKSDEKVLLSKKLVQQIEKFNKALNKCCDLDLQQPIPNKQIALMTNASFGAAGYAVLIEDARVRIHITPQVIRNGRIWFKNLHPSPDKDVPLREGTSCNVLRIQRIGACFLGRAQTGHYPHRH